MANIKLLNISKRFGTRTVLDSVTLEIGEAEFMVFVGPSGCGKSTLLRAIAGFESPDEGEIIIAGRRVNHLPPGEREVAMVFQNYALYPHMTAAENLSFCLKNAGLPGQEIRERVAEIAKVLQIEPLLDRRPHQMSGGQRQRIAIGRAIIRKPKVYLFDEPLSNLDALLRGQTRVELAALHQRIKTTTIYVTHDQVEAMTLADRIAVMNDGRFEQVGTPLELYHHPANIFVAGFIGSPQMNFLPARIAASREGTSTLFIAEQFSLALPPGASLPLEVNNITAGIRAEDFQIERGAGGLRAKVAVVEHLGSHTLIYCDTVLPEGHGRQLVVQQSQYASTLAPVPVKPGDIIRLSAAPDSIHLFDVQGRAVPGEQRQYAETA